MQENANKEAILFFFTCSNSYPQRKKTAPTSKYAQIKRNENTLEYLRARILRGSTHVIGTSFPSKIFKVDFYICL